MTANIKKVDFLKIKTQRIRQKRKGIVPWTIDAKAARRLKLDERAKKKLAIKKALIQDKKETKESRMLID